MRSNLMEDKVEEKVFIAGQKAVEKAEKINQ